MSKKDKVCSAILCGLLFVLGLFIFAFFLGFDSGFSKGKIAEQCNTGKQLEIVCNCNGYSYMRRYFN